MNKRVVLYSAILLAVFGIGYIFLSSNDGATPVPSNVVVVQGNLETASKPRVAVASPIIARSALSDITVLETSTANDTGLGNATVRDGTGTVRRVAVGGWIGDAVLTLVSDTDATFLVRGNKTVLPVTAAPPATGNGATAGGDTYQVPAIVNPGISRP